MRRSTYPRKWYATLLVHVDTIKAGRLFDEIFACAPIDAGPSKIERLAIHAWPEEPGIVRVEALAREWAVPQQPVG